MYCSGIEEMVTQLLPAILEMYRLPDRELATRRTLSYFTIPNPGLTQYKCGCTKPLLSSQQLSTGV